MASQTVAAFLVERLRAWGVDKVFGYPGDGINGILVAISEAGNQPKFIQARHEEMAAFQAVGYAKFTGRTGFCLATSGPGAIHLLNGLYDAKLDHVPVVAIVGHAGRSALGGAYQQEVNLPALFQDVASDYCALVTVPEQLPNVVDRAIRIAAARRAPTAIIVPSDVQELDYVPPGRAHKMVPSSLGAPGEPLIQPDETAIRTAGEILNEAERPAILIGQGARGAAAEVEQVAGALGAGVAKALLGKDVLSDELPFVTGSIGLLGTRPSYEMMRDCDALLTIGSNFPYSEFLPEPGQARGIQIDVDPTRLGLRFPYELNIVADAAPALRALLPLLKSREDFSWQESLIEKTARWWETMRSEALVKAHPVNPMLLFSELSARLPDNSIVTADSGSSAHWYARHLKFHHGIRGSLSGTLATMGNAIPYGIGGKFGYPDRPVIAFEGDGAMQMNGLAELATIARYWREWGDPRFVVAVLHNNDLNLVTWELRSLGGAPMFKESQDLPDVDYAAFARSLGLGGMAVDTPDDVAPAWEAALAADRPTVLDVRTDPDIPPIPPHTTFEQALNAAKSLAKGDPEAWDIITKGFKTKVQEILPRSKGESA